MGFFKNIGKGIKKLTKKIELKGIVKTIKNVGGFIPGIGGAVSGVIGAISDRHEQKKLERQAHAAALAQEKEIQEAQLLLEKNANPDIRQILNGAVGGALTGAGTVLGGSTEAGQAGATIIDNSLSTWLKQNWLKILGGILGTTLIIVLFVRVLKPKKYGRR